MKRESLSDLVVLFEEIQATSASIRRGVAKATVRDAPTPAGRALLQGLLEFGNMTLPQLARLRSTSRQNARIVANRLKESGYVEFVANPAHQRSDLISITLQGRQQLQSSGKHQADWLRELPPHLSNDDVQTATQVLQNIRQFLSGAEVPPLVRQREQRVKRDETKGSQTLTPDKRTSSSQTDDAGSWEEELPVALL